MHEGHTCQPHLQPRTKPVLRQITFDAIALSACGIHDENGRRPDGFESFEVSRMFLDVSFEWDESLVDEVSGFLI